MAECNCQKCLEGRDDHQMVQLGDTLMKMPRIIMILCAICGNKRCPHATDHNNACTNSNEPGQKGSAYE